MANEVGDARRCLSVYPLWRFTSIQKKPISESGIRASRTVADIRHPSKLARVTGQGAHGIAARGRLGLSSLSQHSTQMTLPRAQRIAIQSSRGRPSCRGTACLQPDRRVEVEVTGTR